MEGPSLVITCEELKPFLRKMILKASGEGELPYAQLTGTSLKRVKSWGKHLLLFFTNVNLRIHFLMFGSYRIDKPRPNRHPKLELNYGEHKIFFYSCAIKAQPQGFEKSYDYSVDLMSPLWDEKKAFKSLKSHLDHEVADVLMNQNLFAGLGNIMKNEILFRLKMHPETKIGALSLSKRRALIKEAEAYAWLFYDWKKEGVLKRNWQIMRKRSCPHCGGAVKKRATGNLQRISHYCPRCQPRRLQKQ